MQPQAPATPTILPTIVSTSTAQGTILLQPPAGGPPTAAAAAAGKITSFWIDFISIATRDHSETT